MYPFYVPADPSARPLTRDDVSGVCDVYGPLAGKLGCFLEIDNGGGGCSIAPDRSFLSKRSKRGSSPRKRCR